MGLTIILHLICLLYFLFNASIVLNLLADPPTKGFSPFKKFVVIVLILLIGCLVVAILAIADYFKGL